jgi:manganese/zinc/iron transport system permease protein
MEISGLWIVAIGALVAASCALCGSFLVLRRMAMLGDAISHAVLPGIAIAFLLSGSRQSWVMLLGAGALGILTAILVQALSRGGRVKTDAAIGVTFTSLFALGVILISRYAGDADLDLDCVLYGIIETAPLNTTAVLGVQVPRAFVQSAVVLLICATAIVVFFKELKLVSFDPEMATAVGINAVVVHYGLMALVSLTAVGAFEPVGAILVVAMMAVPPATAYLLTDNLKTMLFLAVGCGVLSAFGGYWAAVWLDASTAGAMSVVAGLLFALALFFSPRHGVLSRYLAHRSSYTEPHLAVENVSPASNGLIRQRLHIRSLSMAFGQVAVRSPPHCIDLSRKEQLRQALQYWKALRRIQAQRSK